MSQNLPADPPHNLAPAPPRTPAPSLSEAQTNMHQPPEPQSTEPTGPRPGQSDVTTPRLRAVTPDTEHHHTIPATVRHAATITTAALALRHQALPHVGVTPTHDEPPEPTPPITLTVAPDPTETPAPTSATSTPALSPAAASPSMSSGRVSAPSSSTSSRSTSELSASTSGLVVVPAPTDDVGASESATDRPARGTGVGPGLPDAGAWGRRLAQAVVEVLAGDRPISQLVRFTDEAVFADLNRRVRVLGLTTTATARGAKERSAVRSIRVCTPANEVVEVAAHVRHGDRSRAIAFRLEIRRNRWICTALELA